MEGVDAISNELLRTLATELSASDTVAMVLAGSAVRNATTAYSDVDVAHIMAEGYAGPEKRFHYRDGRLISVSMRSMSWWRRSITQPERAIFLVPAMRDARILLDPEGEFSRYLRELQDFSWAPLQPAANRFAGAALAAQAETVHKVLSALVRNEGLFESVAPLALDLTQIVAVQRGVLIETSARYMDHVRHAAGDASEWSRFHRTATAQPRHGEPPTTLRAQGLAVLHLYRETYRTIEGIMLPDRRALAADTDSVVQHALESGSLA
ncbi:MAG: hypothetical protein M3Z66_16460 [Chloroflexota bacterium]|nr:hypothetical protein [Chloroflexota bacterium]